MMVAMVVVTKEAVAEPMWLTVSEAETECESWMTAFVVAAAALVMN